MRRAAPAIALGVLVVFGAGRARGADPEIARALAAALPEDGRTDVLVIDRPSVPGAPRVRGAARVNAPPEAVRAALLDAARYGAVIPSLVKAEVRPEGPGVQFVGWELEVPLFNLSGRFALRAAGDQVRLDLFEGDFSPGHLVFTIAPAPHGRATLLIDASLDVRHSTWILRRILKRSPYGEPAALAAAAYVALRGIALRAEHPNAARAWRPDAPPGPPTAWEPDP
ncbi:MAG TPA: SRPBCC family protein, partial [Polyangia bacterium]|nr:SRPBCC family protein [Polyangia bacterium]